MKLRQRIETYWSVWVFNDRLGDGCWEPFEEGYVSKRKARSVLSENAKRYPEERFDLVKTTNVRAVPKRSDAPR